MISVDIPGKGKLTLKNVVLDFNGTIALDGLILPGVEERLNRLSTTLDIYVLTADTFGSVQTACSSINGKVEIISGPLGAPEKLHFIENLGASESVAIGNGTNDRLMLASAALGIAVIGHEGASVKALNTADVVVANINSGLDLLLNSKRLVATLRG